MADNSVTETPVTYDRYGRMNYHPDFHANQGKPWTTKDIKYLVENYDSAGPEEVSFTLERTIHTIMTRAYELRKSGQMPPAPANKMKHKRIRTANC
jgi:hypothetical protein